MDKATDKSQENSRETDRRDISQDKQLSGIAQNIVVEQLQDYIKKTEKGSQNQEDLEPQTD